MQAASEGAGAGLGAGAIISRIWSSEGIAGFWAGIRPNIARTFLVNAAELGTYDQAKTTIISSGLLAEGPLAHVAASGCAGIVSAVTSTPVDVAKTRLMNQAGAAAGVAAGPQYSGMTDALVTIGRTEGFAALYKGFTPVVVRKVLWCSIFFSSFERVRLEYRTWSQRRELEATATLSLPRSTSRAAV